MGALPLGPRLTAHLVSHHLVSSRRQGSAREGSARRERDNIGHKQDFHLSGTGLSVAPPPLAARILTDIAFITPSSALVLITASQFLITYIHSPPAARIPPFLPNPFRASPRPPQFRSIGFQSVILALSAVLVVRRRISSLCCAGALASFALHRWMP